VLFYTKKTKRKLFLCISLDVESKRKKVEKKMQDGIENAGWQRKCRMAKNYSVFLKKKLYVGWGKKRANMWSAR